MPKIAAQDSAQGSLLPKICPRKILVLSQNGYIIGFVPILLLNIILEGFEEMGKKFSFKQSMVDSFKQDIEDEEKEIAMLQARISERKEQIKFLKKQPELQKRIKAFIYLINTKQYDDARELRAKILEEFKNEFGNNSMIGLMNAAQYIESLKWNLILKEYNFESDAAFMAYASDKHIEKKKRKGAAVHNGNLHKLQK